MPGGGKPTGQETKRKQWELENACEKVSGAGDDTRELRCIDGTESFRNDFGEDEDKQRQNA